MEAENKAYKTIKEVADEWGITVRRVQMLCNDGILKGAKKIGRNWVVPADTERPSDNRVVSGKFINANKVSAKSKVREQDYRLLQKVAHDIRTMLNSSLGYADLIQKNAKDPLRVTEYARNIEISGRTTLRMTTNVMEGIRLVQNRISFENQPFSIENLPKDVIRFNLEDIRRKKLNIERHIDIKHEIISADRNKVGLILSNLFDNAVKFSSDGQSIIFSVEELAETEPGTYLYRYTIRDFGSGIDTSFLEKIETFDTYYNNDEISLSGLGIPVAKGYTDCLGGSIHFESRLQEGTTVTVVLPHKVSDLALDANAGLNPEAGTRHIGKRILIADDNELNREIACELLTEVGFKVDSAEDGVICVAKLEQAEAGYYDCILMDIQMPNIDGVLATKIIRGLKDKKKASVPIVAVTANVAKDERNKALTTGMNGFLEKPLKVEQLFSVFDRLFD